MDCLMIFVGAVVLTLSTLPVALMFFANQARTQLRRQGVTAENAAKSLFTKNASNYYVDLHLVPEEELIQTANHNPHDDGPKAA